MFHAKCLKAVLNCYDKQFIDLILTINVQIFAYLSGTKTQLKDSFNITSSPITHCRSTS